MRCYLAWQAVSAFQEIHASTKHGKEWNQGKVWPLCGHRQTTASTAEHLQTYGAVPHLPLAILSGGTVCCEVQWKSTLAIFSFRGKTLLQTDSSGALCKHTCLRAAAAWPLLGLSETVSSSTSNAPARPLSWLSARAWAAAAAAPFSAAASSLASFVTMSTSSLRCSTYSTHTVAVTVMLQVHAVHNVMSQSQLCLCAAQLTLSSSTHKCSTEAEQHACLSLKSMPL